MITFNDSRVRSLTSVDVKSRGRYVLYWCQMSRRLTHNHALDYAIHLAKQLQKPLVIYEGLKLNYPWANARFHLWMLEGMRDNALVAKQLGLTYWPFVETPANNGRGLVKQLAEHAAAVVTDDYPAYITPAHNRVLAKFDRAAFAVDSNSVIPLALYGKPVAAAAHLRPRMHKLFVEAWQHRAHAEPHFDGLPTTQLEPPFPLWQPPADLRAFVASLPLDHSVQPIGEAGGSVAANAVVTQFVKSKLARYAEERNEPDDPQRSAVSGLSAAMHYGHISIEAIIAATLGHDWKPSEINAKTRNKDDFFCRDANVNSFLDEAIVWRDLGYHWHYARNLERGSGTVSWSNEARASFNFATMDFSPSDHATLPQVLPEWAWATLSNHANDRREYLYSWEQFEHADTHDELWNAAQLELVKTGRIHNYLRMLWAKKVLEWSESPEEAYRVLEYLNNKYAVDGRDPNSYTGILWCFGLFDRPWPPERDVFGNIRYMSSANTAKKFKLANYYQYVRRLA
jgi:deoxyribodipyrimidine photo-lyase